MGFGEESTRTEGETGNTCIKKWGFQEFNEGRTVINKEA